MYMTCIYIYIYIYVYIYIYIYVCTCIYTPIYIYTYDTHAVLEFMVETENGTFLQKSKSTKKNECFFQILYRELCLQKINM
jgi:hypothetical protein